jgi:hypothetical protein
MTTAYPLCWPENMPRARHRESGQFKTTLIGALKNVEDSLRKFGGDSGVQVKEIVLSSNVTLGAHRPQDPGVAAWFKWGEEQVCIPVDRYSTVEANLQAIHHIIEARRVELRHGTLSLVRASMQGFKALPAPPGESWPEILELKPGATREEVQEAFRRLSVEAHPDKPGGSEAKMAKLTSARDRAMKQIGKA